MKILIIGGGNMGKTYAQSFLRSHVTSAQNLSILERSEEKAKKLAQLNIGTVHSELNTCVPNADLIILAVKPQDIKNLINNLSRFITENHVVLSIMAGVSIKVLASSTNTKKVVRAMPNLPAQIGLGMTVFTSTDEVTRGELVQIHNLLSTTGKTLYVEDENMIDAATAISGSGPAYVWYFMDAMMLAARKMGFNESQAEIIVNQTFAGSINLFIKSELNTQEWIKRVSSRGGTTEAAINQFDNDNLYEDIIRGSMVALDRAIELGKIADVNKKN